MKKDLLTISEIFGPTIQGEGPVCGSPSVFIRVGGCDYRCVWCDTLYAVLPENRRQWKRMSTGDVWSEVKALHDTPILVTLSGGNPAIQPFEPLIDLGLSEGYSFSIETQGSLYRPWFKKIEKVVLSPKPPSSGMGFDEDALDVCISSLKREQCFLKFVIFDDADYAFARKIARQYPEHDIYLQPGFRTPAYLEETSHENEDMMTAMRWLCDKVLQDRWTDVKVLPQMHRLLWGDERGR